MIIENNITREAREYMQQCFRDVGFNISTMNEAAEIIYNSEKGYNYKIGDFGYYCARIDECIEVFYTLNMSEDGGEDEVSVGYSEGNVYDVLKPEKVENTTKSDYVRLRFDGVRYPIDVQLLCKAMAVNFKDDVQYIANVACFALEMKCYESVLEYINDFEGMSAQAIAHIGYKLQDNPPIIGINGVVKSFKLKTNSYTGIKYYHIEVESLDKSFVVLAEEAFVQTELYVGMIISTTCWCTAAVTEKSGESYNFDFDENTEAEKFIEEVSENIVSLRDLPFEHVCVSFSEGTQIDNITFVQTANYGTHYMLEIGKNIDGKNYLFRLEETELQIVLKTFHSICVEKTSPDTSKWEDVTYLLSKDGED